jgi:hypothetical protein
MAMFFELPEEQDLMLIQRTKSFWDEDAIDNDYDRDSIGDTTSIVTESDDDSRDDVESSSPNAETSGRCVLRATPSLDRTDEIVFLGFQDASFSRSAVLYSLLDEESYDDVEYEDTLCDEFSDIAIFASTLSTTGQSPSAEDLPSATAFSPFHFEQRRTFKKVKKLDHSTNQCSSQSTLEEAAYSSPTCVRKLSTRSLDQDQIRLIHTASTVSHHSQESEHNDGAHQQELSRAMGTWLYQEQDERSKN